MTIGNLLRQYRIQQNKKQREFSENILSPSYYSKVEKDQHRISADDLIKLLMYNHISVKKFFEDLDKDGEEKQLLIENISSLMSQAYFKSDIHELGDIKQKIINSNLSKEDKTDQLLYADTFIALITNKIQDNIELKDQVREKFLNMPEFNETKIMLYCNTMRFYTAEDNLIISQMLLNKYRDSNNIIIQKYLVSISINMLVILIESNRLNETSYYINALTGRLDNPDLFFYKAAFVFLSNFIDYKKSHDLKKLESCNQAIAAFKTFSMEEYAKELTKFLEKYE